MAYALWTGGRLHDSIPYHLKQVDAAKRAGAGGALFALGHVGAVSAAAFRHAQLGDHAGAQALLTALAPDVERLRQEEPAGSMPVRVAEGGVTGGVFIEERVVKKESGLRDGRTMRHECQFTQPRGANA